MEKSYPSSSLLVGKILSGNVANLINHFLMNSSDVDPGLGSMGAGGVDCGIGSLGAPADVDGK